MKIEITPVSSLPSSTQVIVREGMAMGYAFGCPCGEQHRTAESAYVCRKCRSYLSDEDRIGAPILHFTDAELSDTDMEGNQR